MDIMPQHVKKVNRNACAVYFFTFSQSDRNVSIPRSVSGCLTIILKTLNGIVAMSANIVVLGPRALHS